MFIEVARECAKNIPVQSNRQRLYALAVDAKGKVVGESANSYTKSHPLQKHFSVLAGLSDEKCYLHAELAALLKARTKKVDTVYVARIMKDGTEGIAKPCNACMKALEAFGVRKVVYTDSGNWVRYLYL